MKYEESSNQQAFIEWASYNKAVWPYLIHVRNEGKMSPQAGARAKREGRKKGVWDLFFAFPVKPYHGLWIEMKSAKGTLTKEQKAWGELMNTVDYAIGVAYSYEDAVKIIEDYLSGEY